MTKWVNIRRKVTTLKAVQWFELGDHPDVYEHGKSGQFCIDDPCDQGLLVTNVFPGDWIIALPSGSFFVCSPDRFAGIYEVING